MEASDIISVKRDRQKNNPEETRKKYIPTKVKLFMLKVVPLFYNNNNNFIVILKIYLGYFFLIIEFLLPWKK